MRADNSHYVVAAARHRAEQTRQRAVAALQRMDATGQRINFDTVARKAGVSRSWLYAQDDLKAEIQRLRSRCSPTQAATVVPDRQRATDASLLRRLEAATTRIQSLTDENRQLREALARALGEHRAAAVRGSTQDRR
jgi:uncharacterized protein DUF6262